MADPLERPSTSLFQSQMLRLFSIGLLALVLLIPIGMISGLINERQARRDATVEEIASKWGRRQHLTAPALVVPYTLRWAETGAAGQTIPRSETHTAVFLPDSVSLRGTIHSETRQRGIFSVPVYRLDLQVEGEFARPDFAALGLEKAEIAWDRAHLAVGLSDARAIQKETAVSWNGSSVAFVPGNGGLAEASPGIHAIVDLSDGNVASHAPANSHPDGFAPPKDDADAVAVTNADPASPEQTKAKPAEPRHTIPTDRFRFSFPLALNGSVAVYFAPFGKQTEVLVSADNGNPTFQGNWLPTERTITANTFEARWSIPFLGRNFPQAWKSSEPMQEAIDTAQFGVGFIDPVDHYRMAERSVKYASLFILLTFATIWLVEILAGLRVHPIQYLMLGGALCLFYLLELSLAEHIGFPAAYAIASLAIITMITTYSAVALQSRPRSLVVGSGVALLYGYLYILLNNEDFALLIGSLGLFAILAAIMFATRQIDWYTVGRGAPIAAPPTHQPAA
ncbi:cell envelope integrity protein CreD [Myxococcota bacterium]|nr:cell envelope integrity protein CreD [Myxococcota bacterium]